MLKDIRWYIANLFTSVCMAVGLVLAAVWTLGTAVYFIITGLFGIPADDSTDEDEG